MDERFVEIAQLLDGEAAQHGHDPLDEEQKDALADPVEAFGMLDDLEARCGWNVDSARIGLSKLHYYVPGNAAVLADLEEAAQQLIGRYKVVSDEAVDFLDGPVTHAAMAAGAVSESWEPNTGGFVWLSGTVHDAPRGRRLFASAGCDSICVYLVPERFDEAEEQAPSGRNTAERMTAHVWAMMGEDEHMVVAKWYVGEE